MRIIVAITGASGAIFAVDLLRRAKAEKVLIASRWGRYVLKEETGLELNHLAEHANYVFSDEDMSAPPASGSTPFDAMIIIPCSASTMAKIACGIGDTLITRTAQVALKEKRPLIIALRETPLSMLHLEQAHKLAQAGATLMPISPPFYHRPQSIDAMVEQFNRKLLALVGIDTAVAWRSEAFE